MAQNPDFDLMARAETRHTFIAVKLWSEDRWDFVQIPITIHNKARLELAVQDNAVLWEKVRNLDDNAARQVASQAD